MKEEQKLKALSHQFWKDFCLRFFQASWEVELLISFCNVAVLIVFRMMQVKVPVVGAETFPVLGELWEERKEEEEELEEEEEDEEGVTQSLSEEVEEGKDQFLEPGLMEQSFSIFVDGAGKSCVLVIDADMTIEDLEHSIQEVMCLPKGLFFLTLSAKLLDANRMQSLVRDVSVRVNFRLRGGMMRVPKDSPGQWTCDYCGINRCWVTRSTCYRCGEARGHTEDLQRHYRNMAREAREKGTSGASVPVASSSTSPPWAAKALPPRSVPPRTSSPAPWASSKSLSEVDKIHDNDQTALLRTALALFENCDLPPGVLDEIRKVVLPHRPPTRKAPKVSREQIVLNMIKKFEKEEQELRDRKSSLDQARKLVAKRQQKDMDQATVVSDLKMQLVELRQNIANNPTPEVSQDEDVDATPLGVPLAPPAAVPPAVPPENTPLNLMGDDMDDDLLEEANPPATKREGEFGVIQVPTNRQEFQQWTAGLDRESVREGLLHFQALHEQHEREEHARQAEAMERASASSTVADDETPSG